jgi:hypothetical protein
MPLLTGFHVCGFVLNFEVGRLRIMKIIMMSPISGSRGCILGLIKFYIRNHISSRYYINKSCSSAQYIIMFFSLSCHNRKHNKTLRKVSITLSSHKQQVHLPSANAPLFISVIGGCFDFSTESCLQEEIAYGLRYAELSRPLKQQKRRK